MCSGDEMGEGRSMPIDRSRLAPIETSKASVVCLPESRSAMPRSMRSPPGSSRMRSKTAFIGSRLASQHSVIGLLDFKLCPELPSHAAHLAVRRTVRMWVGSRRIFEGSIGRLLRLELASGTSRATSRLSITEPLRNRAGAPVDRWPRREASSGDPASARPTERPFGPSATPAVSAQLPGRRGVARAAVSRGRRALPGVVPAIRAADRPPARLPQDHWQTAGERDQGCPGAVAGL